MLSQLCHLPLHHILITSYVYFPSNNEQALDYFRVNFLFFIVFNQNDLKMMQKNAKRAGNTNVKTKVSKASSSDKDLQSKADVRQTRSKRSIATSKQVDENPAKRTKMDQKDPVDDANSLGPIEGF